MFDLFGGSFDLALIETLTVTILDSANRAWLEKIIPSLQGANVENTIDHELLNRGDLSMAEVNELVAWAEKVQYTPGLVHGERRRAAGIELLRRGIEVLKGKVATPRDSDPRKTVIPV